MRQTDEWPEVHDPLMVPTQEEWARMTESQRVAREEEIISALEREFNMMGETTLHFDSRASATEVLRRFFKEQGRDVFVASDLHTLYPGERAFYPDLLVVFDVPDYHRRSWNVLREGKGLDFVLEILSKETRRKDLLEKRNLYARLGIPEYFIFDSDAMELRGYELDHHFYRDMKPKDGYLFSRVLGLRVGVDGENLRFSVREGLEIPFVHELVSRLNQKIAEKEKRLFDYSKEMKRLEQWAEEEKQRAEEEKQRAEEEKQRAEEEKQRAEEEKQRADKAEEELKRLQRLLDARPNPESRPLTSQDEATG